MQNPSSKMEIQVISQEKIKPSSPTPCHLRNYELCLLDQLIPAPYAPIILFYPNHNSAHCPQILNRLTLLKQSLSQTLTLFHPLAGTIRDDFSIDCDDQGVNYITTRVLNSHLFEFLNCPDIKSLVKFLPCNPSFMGPLQGTCVANMQVNVFECFGIAVGSCISHRVLDGSGLSTFLKSWTEIAKSVSFSTVGEMKICPDYPASTLFPANNDSWLKKTSMAMWASVFKKGKSVTKRFVFSGSAISILKSMAISPDGKQTPSRVQTVSGFLWKCLVSATGEKCGVKNPSMVTHTVNLRKRAVPNFPDHSLGNLVWVSAAKSTANDEDFNFTLPELVKKVQKSISKIDGEYVKKLRGTQGANFMQKSLKDIAEFGSKTGAVDYFGFTSWCRFGFYEADFGWGKPVWVSSFCIDASVFMNFIVLNDTRSGDGIEAWVTLDEGDMGRLEQDEELLAFASLDPSPLFNFAT